MRANWSIGKSLCTGAAVASLIWLTGCASSVDLNRAGEKDTRYSNVDELGNRAEQIQTDPTDDAVKNSVATIDAYAEGYTGTGPAGAADTIYFGYDSFSIPQQYLGDVQQHASFIMNNGTGSVVIEGHADERGSSEYNLALGQKRADAVKKAMVLLGASDAVIESISYGEERPAAEGSNEAAWSQNRRAQIMYR